jgi:cobalt-zinc-cadmium efflux system outer membrane protein
MFFIKKSSKIGVSCFFILLFFGVTLTKVFSQTSPDILNLSLKDLDKIFLDKNLALLVSKANIDINRAYKSQALLWDNPQISTEIGSINILQPNYGDAGFQQIYGQVSQLIKLAKKRQNLRHNFPKHSFTI